MPTEEKQPNKEKLPPKLLKAISYYSKITDARLKNEKEENDSAITSAVWYEKIRAAMEYQESHLMFKNAVFRILQRSLLVSTKSKPEKMLNSLVNELVWANYIKPNTIDEAKSADIIKILDKYSRIIRRSNSVNRNHTEMVRYFCGLCACEIEEYLFDKRAENQLMDFIFSAVIDNFEFNPAHISKEDHEIQIKLAIYTNVFKPDHILLTYYALKLTYPNWTKITEEEYLKITKSIDPFVSSFERAIFMSFRNRYLLATRSMTAPFMILKTYLLTSEIDEQWAESNPTMMEYNLVQAYESLRVQSNLKIWRGIWRALIFLFVSKITLAFIIEVPVDRLIHGRILWFPLIANISFPPLLMFLSGASIPKIPMRNSERMQEALAEIVTKGKFTIEKPIMIERKQISNASRIFNYVLSVYSLAIIILVLWLLLKLKFTVVSILLFFVFVSAVSFLSFRIRVNSKELLVKRKSQDSITTLVEFLFLPFISLGKVMSDGLNRLNPMLLAVDFVIEAPFKTIIKILRTWFNFISAKKEEMEY